MTTYKELYFHLFNALTDAIEAFETGRFADAINGMKQAQIDAEDAHLQTEVLKDE